MVDRLVWHRRSGQPLSFAARRGERLYVCGAAAPALLLTLAGFSPAASGFIACDNRDVTPLPAPARHIAYIPPGDSLIGRLTLLDNVALPGGRRAKAAEMLRQLGLADWSGRPASALSAEQRRLGALARALAADPSLLLVDEGDGPPAISDALTAPPGPPVIVAAPAAAALARADRILLLRDDGGAAQLGAPRDLHERPADAFAAAWSGACNLIPAALLGPGDAPGSVTALVAGRAMSARIRDAAHGPARLVVRPHRLLLADAGLPATLIGIDYQGAVTRLRLDAGTGAPLLLDTADPPPLSPGDAVRVTWRWSDAWPVRGENAA